MKFKDYYEILGVPETASQDEIKRAYRKKARLYHPDVSTEADSEEKFKEVNEAHEALRDEKRRAEYDQLKRYGFKSGDDFQGNPQWQRTGGFGADGFGQNEFGDFFESIFGAGSFRHDGYAGQARRAPMQGDDIRLTVRVALENAYNGGKTRIKVPGSHGAESRQLSVNIPAGVTDGQQLRLRAQGRAGANGGPSGDLVITVKIKPHSVFKVDGKDIVLELPLSPYESATGLVLPVPTLGGEVSMTIPAGTHSGKKMRLRGRGLPGSPQGDQLVEIHVVVLDNLSTESLALLKQFDETVADDPRSCLYQATAHD